MPDLSDRHKPAGIITVTDVVSFITSALFIGLSLYTGFILAAVNEAHARDIRSIALLTGAYGLVRLWRTIRAVQAHRNHVHQNH
ncbi:hypothetical protein [Prosthecochloris sp. ZM_2]|uniref:hypothetical protein n=1 Tax=Prosthecochloris sp. ZM_2 TaxID=2045206 RepID=UPI000E12547B|nr:hypothetical protein [Prosthecochloris sp. ZM_2]